MSDTPRTDAELKRVADQLDGGEDNAAYVMSQLGAHACMLEREVERLREAAKQALERLALYYGGNGFSADAEAIKALHAVLKETK